MGFNPAFKGLSMARNLNTEACVGLSKWGTSRTPSSISNATASPKEW